MQFCEQTHLESRGKFGDLRTTRSISTVISLVKAVVQVVVTQKAFLLLWAVMDILCRDTSVAAMASKEFVRQIQQSDLSPWQLLWCLSKMAQQVFMLSSPAVVSVREIC